MGQNLSVIARRLREARINAKISQKSLGIAAGIDEFSASARINQYERGKHVPDLLTAERLAKVLEVPLAYFYAADDLLASLILAFYKLDIAQQRLLLSKLEQSS